MPISAHDLAAAWNQQADADDQWDSLGLYEQLAWAQSRAIAADRARWGGSTPHLEPESAADCLAARPLMARVAAMGDCIGRHTVGEIIDISDQAASWLAANPPGQPPAAGEAAELAAELRHFIAEYQKFCGLDPENIYSIHQGIPEKEAHLRISRLTRAAELLQRFVSPACLVVNSPPEAIAALKAAGHGEFMALEADMQLIESAAPQPVAVAERPWEREGWCDEQGMCWLGDPGGGEFIPSWHLCRPEDAPSMKVSLPANALPTPEAQP